MRRILPISTSLLAVWLLAGCDSTPTEPTPSFTPAPAPGPATGPVAARPSTLLVDVPVSLAPGETGRVRASARYTDGSVQDVTPQAVWTSSDPSIVSITGDGVATGHAVGESFISFRFADKDSGRRSLIVLPPGTHMLTGAALALDGDAAVLGAHVEVLTQDGTRVTDSITDWGGFTFFGVPPDGLIRASREGFATTTVPVSSAGGTSVRRSLNVRLSRVAPRPDYTGTYALTITAACEPGSSFSDALRERRYRAVVTQDARLMLTVQLSGATFFKFFQWSSVGTPGTFVGYASDDRARFYLVDSFDWGVNADLAEQLPDKSGLVIHGTADVTVTPSGFAGTLAGSFDLHPAGTWAPSTSCKSSAHKFVMSR